MGIFDKLGVWVRRKIHQREIEDGVRSYERQHQQKADAKEAFADVGTFRTHLERLYTLGNASETGELRRIAESVVTSTLTNRYYRAGDYLSDILDDLERHTYLTGEPHGEPPLTALAEAFERELKLKAVAEAWLVPLKVGAIETAVATHGDIVGRILPYPALQRFERNVARLFALTEQSECKLVLEQVSQLLEHWRDQEALQARFAEPADAVARVLAFLSGESRPDEVSYLRTRRSDAPMRLSTVVPEDRQHYLRASLDRWNLEP